MFNDYPGNKLLLENVQIVNTRSRRPHSTNYGPHNYKTGHVTSRRERLRNNEKRTWKARKRADFLC